MESPLGSSGTVGAHMACSDRPSPETAGVNTNPLGYVTQYPSVTSRPVANSTGKSDWHRAAITGPYSGPTGRKRVNFASNLCQRSSAKRIKLTEKAEPLISEMEAVINKTRAEILHGISAEELEQLITLIAKLEHNIIELQAKG